MAKESLDVCQRFCSSLFACDTWIVIMYAARINRRVPSVPGRTALSWNTVMGFDNLLVPDT